MNDHAKQVCVSEFDARKMPERYVAYLKNRDNLATMAVEGISVDIFPGVFPPATDTRLLACNLKPYIHKEGVRVLDIASGSGVLAMLAGLYGASGLAVDISATAVENSNHNFHKYDVSFVAMQSDVFDHMPLQKFETILATPPYLDGKVVDPLDYAIYGTSHFVDSLLENARNYLAVDGKMLVTYAKWGLIGKFEHKLVAHRWRFRVIGTKTSADGQRQYDLYEIW